jgi:hypothetical protein
MIATKKKSFNAGLDDLLEGLDLPSNDELMQETKGKKITESKLSITPKKAEEIWMKLWGPDRSVSLYKQLAAEYKVGEFVVQGLALGDHPLCPVNRNQWESIYQEWHNRYGYNKSVYVVRSPGNDLLDYYDAQNLKRGAKTSKLSPSEIFDIRFTHNRDKAYAKDLLKKKGLKVDPNMISGYANDIMGWLVDEPHQEWEFDSLVEMSQWLFKQAGKEWKKGGQLAEGYIKKEMLWMDRGYGLNGWSFVKKSK